MAFPRPSLGDLQARLREVIAADTDTGFFDNLTPGMASWLNEGFVLQHEAVLKALRAKGELADQLHHPYLQRFVRVASGRVAQNSNVLVLNAPFQPVAPVLGAEVVGGALASATAYRSVIRFFDPVRDEYSYLSVPSNGVLITVDNNKLPATLAASPGWETRFTTLHIYRTKVGSSSYYLETTITGVLNADSEPPATGQFVGTVPDIDLGDQAGEVLTTAQQALGEPMSLKEREVIAIRELDAPPREGVTFSRGTPERIALARRGSPIWALSPYQGLWERATSDAEIYVYFDTENLKAASSTPLDVFWLQSPADFGIFDTDLAALAPVAERYCQAPLAWATARLMERMMQPPDAYEDRFREMVGLIP